MMNRGDLTGCPFVLSINNIMPDFFLTKRRLQICWNSHHMWIAQGGGISSYMLSGVYSATRATQRKLTNQIIGKYQYTPRKLVVDQSAARKKTISRNKHKILILITNVFQGSKCFTDYVFLFKILHVTPRTQAVILSSTSIFAAIAALCNNSTIIFI